MRESGETGPPSGRVFGPEGLERRRAPRMAPPSSPRISVVGARLLNASPFGMMIESPVAMAPEAILRLRLVIAGDKFDIEARVAECSPLPAHPGAWGVGLEFAQLPQGALDKLRAALGVSTG